MGSEKVVILGCGYVGKQVAQLWQQQGLTVTATTTRPERIPELHPVANDVRVLRGTDQALLREALEGQSCVLVSVAGGRSASYEDTYLKTAQSLVAVLPDIPSVRQIIFTSTYSIYGNYNGNWVTEETPLKPATANAQVMAQTEQVLLSAAQENRKVCIFRLGGIYGPGRELAKIYSRAAGTTRPGTGEEGSNWIHLDDIVGAIAFARKQQLNGIYNLVQDEIPTVRELIERVCRSQGLANVTWDSSQPSDRPYNVRVSNQKLKAAGYRFVHPTFDLPG
ncbi:MAG TPA: SDR family oxidoreductase [Leptolyngbyaceae cyanobacterium]